MRPAANARPMSATDTITNDDGFRDFQRRILRTPRLTAAEEAALAGRIAQGDTDARQRLIEANLRLVVHLARQVHRPGSALSLMELVQDGSVGLIRAAEKYDHRRGARFATYAAWWIRAALLRAIDERAPLVRLPEDVRTDVKRVRIAERQLESELRRTPTTAEVADALDFDADQVAELKAATLRPSSLNATSTDDADRDLADTLRDDRSPEPAAELVGAERRADLTTLLAALRPVERRVLELRYGLNGHEAATRREAARQPAPARRAGPACRGAGAQAARRPSRGAHAARSRLTRIATKAPADHVGGQ